MRPSHEYLDLNLLRIFVTIVSEKSISAAAKKLYVTQPAISSSLKRLESQLQTSLIERSSQHFHVTESGLKVYEESLKILSQVSRLCLEIGNDEDRIEGNVKIGIVSGVNLDVLNDSLEHLHATHPSITCEFVELLSQDVIQSVAFESLSLGITTLPLKIQNINSFLLGKQIYRIYCGRKHPLFNSANISLENIKEYDWVSYTKSQLNGSLFEIEKFRVRHGLVGKSKATTKSLNEAKRLIKCGWGIGCLPEDFAKDEVKEFNLMALPPNDGIACIDLHVIWNSKTNLTRAEEAAISIIKKHALFF